MRENGKNKDIIDTAASLVKEVVKGADDIKDLLIRRDQVSAATYIDSRSSELDKIIKNIETESLCSFVSGEVGLFLDEGDECHMECNFYFIDNRKNWTNKKIVGKKYNIEWILISEDQEILKKEKSIKFEYIKG